MTGVVVEVKQFDQYVIRVDGSGRATLRNRQFLRKYTPAIDKTVITPSVQHTPTGFYAPTSSAPPESATNTPSTPSTDVTTTPAHPPVLSHPDVPMTENPVDTPEVPAPVNHSDEPPTSNNETERLASPTPSPLPIRTSSRCNKAQLPYKYEAFVMK